MKCTDSATVILALAMFVAGISPVLCHEEIATTGSSEEFVSSLESSVSRLDEEGYFERLELPGFGSRFTEQDVQRLILDIQNLGITPPTEAYYGLGDSTVTYDIVLQPGHFLRERCCNNKTGSSGMIDGNTIYEQDYAAYVSLEIAKILSARGRDILVIPADEGQFSSPLRAKIFLAIHLDGSQVECSVSSSLGYGSKDDVLGAHTIGLALATALGIDYSDFTEDNYTANLSDYYTFKHVHTDIFEAVLELAELSCPRQAYEVLLSSPRIIRNMSEAIDSILKMKEE